jgi:Cytochrome c554 and c-prime
MLLTPLLLLALGTGGLESPGSAEVCGRCHRAIHESWKTSAHSQAMESRLFQDVLDMTAADFGPSARKVCLGCHAPMAVQTGDWALERKVSWEGVTCDYCHSIREINWEGPNPKAILNVGAIKTGPLKDAVSTAHQTAYSPVHTSAAICAPCHEYKNALGFPVLTTYSEWKASPYWKEGKQCQSCHMSRVAGDVVDPRVARVHTAQINLHQMPGSHSLTQLNKAIRAQLHTAHDGDQLRVTVEIANERAGHYLPTGSPLRELVMELQADSAGGQHFREERVYARRVADRHGTVIMREHFAFLRAVKVVSDTRLAPGEKRVEKFVFPIPKGSQTEVKATFWYYYSPLAKTESQKRITFLTLSRFVP